MSFMLTELELQAYNLSFWVKSSKVEFGHFTLDEKAVEHELKFDRSVRFHKPTQNKCDPSRFIIRSLAKVIDGVRGPLRLDGKLTMRFPSNVRAELVAHLHGIQNDPQHALKETILNHPWLSVRQVKNEAILVTDKLNGRVYSHWGLQEADWEIFISEATENICARMGKDKVKDCVALASTKQALTGQVPASVRFTSEVSKVLDPETLVTRYSESTVLHETDTARIVYHRVGDVVVDSEGKLVIELGEAILEETARTERSETAKVFSALLRSVLESIPQYHLENYISSCLNLKLGTLPTETTVVFHCDDIKVTYIKKEAA